MTKPRSDHFALGSAHPAPRGAIWTVDGPQVYDARTPRDILEEQEGEPEPDRGAIFRQAMGSLFLDGPHPSMVMRHAFRMAQEVDASLLRGLPTAELRATCSGEEWAHLSRIDGLLAGTRVQHRSPAMHEKEIQKTLTAAHTRLRAQTFDRGASLAELLSHQDDETAAEYQARMEGMAAFLRFFFMKGPSPAIVIRRVYCVAKGVTPHHVLNMTLKQLGDLFGEVRATWSWRVKQVVNGFLKHCGGRAVKLPFQKSDEACAKYAQAQVGNRNRRGGGPLEMSA